MNNIIKYKMISLMLNNWIDIMASVTIRNLPDEVHRALRIRAAHNERSTEAEIRAILENSVLPPERIKLGTLLSSIAREGGGLTADEAEVFDRIRDKTPAVPMVFE